MKNPIVKIKEIIKENSLINTYTEGDVFNLNNAKNTRYPVANVDLESATISIDYVNQTIRIFYIDRLLDDKSNQLQIQIDAVYVLNKIFGDIVEVVKTNTSEPNVVFFEQRFTDMCAGGYIEFQTEDCV